MPDRDDVARWVDRYERAWRVGGPVMLDNLFTEEVTYVRSPWATPIRGRVALQRFWNDARHGPDEGFQMTSDVVTIDGRTVVVRVHVDYDDGQRWRNLWVVTLDDHNRCEHFEEWPFAPDQDDGHRDDHGA